MRIPLLVQRACGVYAAIQVAGRPQYRGKQETTDLLKNLVDNPDQTILDIDNKPSQELTALELSVKIRKMELGRSLA